MSERRALEALARSHGVQLHYRDLSGRRRSASTEALLAVTRALGALEASDSPAGAAAALERRRWELAGRLLAPVAVAWGGARTAVPVVPPPGAGDACRLDCRLELEDGPDRSWSVRLGELPAARRGGELRLPLPPLPLGLHRLHATLRRGRRTIGRGAARVIAAPRRAWSPASEDGPAPRAWGVFAPLYGLHRESGAAGAYPDLGELGEWVAGLGGSTVATLPLDAAFLDEPFDPSPYAPASRLFANELYVDPRRLPEWRLVPDAAALEAAAAGEGCAQDDLLDYRRLAADRRRALAACARAFFEPPAGDSPPAERRAAFEVFLARRPEAADYAAFRATGERLRAAWPAWPERQRGGTLEPGDYDEAGRRYHLYAQWAADEQLAAAARRLEAAAPGRPGAGLYLDLPLGVGGASWDVWRHRGLFATGVSAGAPPDTLFTRGQSWGFPPLHPERLAADGLDHFRAVVARHLEHAALLRIDHVMQLHRLFWVPNGLPATEGVYVRYPAAALLAVLTLESHRARAAIVGENLGTVPAEVERDMRRRGLLGMFVVQYEGGGDDRLTRRPAPADAVASLNTHDMPPFASFLAGDDVADQQALGLLDAEQAAADRAARARRRAAMVRALHLEAAAKAEEVAAAALAELGAGQAPLVLVNLEDLWGERRPQNVPGTSTERPNWRRRLGPTLEEIRRHPGVRRALEALDRARREDEMSDRDRRDEGPGGRSALLEEIPAEEASPPTGGRGRLTADDLHLFNEGRHFRLYDKLGAHPAEVDGERGWTFGVWAPAAAEVSVIGDWNGWRPGRDALEPRGRSGVWEGFVAGAPAGASYKYHVVSHHRGYRVDKADPFAFASEAPPQTGSRLWQPEGHAWGDDDWMATRGERIGRDAPVSIYELHPGSWRRTAEDPERFLSWRELAPAVAAHARAHGFTHVELLPVMEHPFYGSWGYQTTSYFAPSSRYGSPTDLMAFVDHLHREGIGVILDWVPSHFPTDEHGLGFFDGTHLYEHADPREGFHPDWGTLIFDYGRPEVRSFLVSSALFWLERFHVDGLRVDAVASMLYRDYSRRAGEWIPNVHGGRENLEAIDFLRQLNTEIQRSFPDVRTFAEESTAWPKVSRPVEEGGLGFGYKWDMGWMHDTLAYLAHEPVHRRWHHDQLTFRPMYAFSESFVLPLSHDEVVHGKGSLLGKMPGDEWQKRANLRLLYAHQWAQPGKKLLFMGGELGQWREWAHDGGLDWHLADQPSHQGIARLVADLNRLYRDEPALHELDCDPAGFEWIAGGDAERSVIAFLRHGRADGETVLAVFNFTPVVREGYRLGVPAAGTWRELLNTDATVYGGGGVGNLGSVEATPEPHDGRPASIAATLPPLGALFLKAPTASADASAAEARR